MFVRCPDTRQCFFRAIRGYMVAAYSKVHIGQRSCDETKTELLINVCIDYFFFHIYVHLIKRLKVEKNTLNGSFLINRDKFLSVWLIQEILMFPSIHIILKKYMIVHLRISYEMITRKYIII